MDFNKIDEKKAKDQRLLKQIVGLIKDKDLIQKQRDVLARYFQQQLSRPDIKLISVYNIAVQLVPFLKSIPKPIEEITNEDISKYFYDLKIGGKSSQSTTAHRISIIKIFFFWYYKEFGIKYEGDAPKVIAHIKAKRPNNKLKPSDMLTRVEVRKMIDACHKVRDKAILSVLYETGCRAGELLGINISDVQHETHSADIDLDGKTGRRTVTVVESYPILLEYLNTHPYKDQPDTPLFINLSNAQFGRRFLYQGLVSLIRTISKRAGLMKWGVVTKPNGKVSYERLSGRKISPHLFRHSRCTELASEKMWTEPELRIQFGWTERSQTPTIYSHVGRKSIKRKLLQEQGLSDEDMVTENIENNEALRPKTCSRCNYNSPASYVACPKCGTALSIFDARKLKELRKKTDEFEDKIQEIPIRSHLIHGNMTPYEYKKELIKSDSFLRNEFEKIAREVLETMMLKKEIQEKKEKFESGNGKIVSKFRVRDENREKVLNLRKKGWPMETIAKELGVGYGTVRTICEEQNLTQIY